MNFTKEQIETALAAGLALVNPEDESITVPMKHAAGCLILRELLMLLATGQVGLAPVMREEPPTRKRKSKGPVPKKGKPKAPATKKSPRRKK